jgi:hypothetical protein
VFPQDREKREDVLQNPRVNSPSQYLFEHPRILRPNGVRFRRLKNPLTDWPECLKLLHSEFHPGGMSGLVRAGLPKVFTIHYDVLPALDRNPHARVPQITGRLDNLAHFESHSMTGCDSRDDYWRDWLGSPGIVPPVLHCVGRVQFKQPFFAKLA